MTKLERIVYGYVEISIVGTVNLNELKEVKLTCAREEYRPALKLALQRRTRIAPNPSRSKF